MGNFSLFTDNYFYMNQQISGKALDSYYESAHLGNSNGKYLFSSMYSDYTSINIVHALPKIINPVYLIYSKENENAQEVIDSYTSYNASIKSAFVKNSKYLPQMENPSELLVQLESFLNAL